MRRILGGRRRRVALLTGVLVGGLMLSSCGFGAPVKGGAPGAGCPIPNVGGWNHYTNAFSSGLRPDANWPVTPGANGTSVFAPVGNAVTGLAFAADPFGVVGNVNNVANNFFNLGSVSNVQILSASGAYPANGGLQRDFEFTGTNVSELSQGGAAVRGRLTALYVAAGASSFWLTWLELSEANLFGFVCGTLRAIRNTMFTSPQPPPSL